MTMRPTLHNTRLAGEGQALTRQIPSGYTFDPRAIKPLTRMLWAMSVSLGHALTAYRQFTKVKSATMSPDGMLGGRGYVMEVTDIRKRLYDACESLSAISDTIYDEIQASHWKPQLSDLPYEDQEDIEHLLTDAERILDAPEEAAEKELDEVEEEGSSKTAASDDVCTRVMSRWAASAVGTRSSIAVSSVPPHTLDGPRVDHLDSVGGEGPFGSYNLDESVEGDNWDMTEGVGMDHLYQNDWANNWSVESASVLPFDDTPTEAHDYGLGFGARGQGTDSYGLEMSDDPSSVWSESAKLPGDFGDYSLSPDAAAMLTDHSINTASDDCDCRLPGEDVPVARSHYYDGWKDGPVMAGSQLPGEALGTFDTELGLLGKSKVVERIDQPAYVRYDSSTHEDMMGRSHGEDFGPYTEQ